MSNEADNKNCCTCKICGMKYADKEIAKKCEAWCKENKSCNLDFIKHAIYD